MMIIDSKYDVFSIHLKHYFDLEFPLERNKIKTKNMKKGPSDIFQVKREKSSSFIIKLRTWIQIEGLQNRKFSGFDHLSAPVIKYLVDQLSKPLCHNKSSTMTGRPKALKFGEHLCITKQTLQKLCFVNSQFVNKLNKYHK